MSIPLIILILVVLSAIIYFSGRNPFKESERGDFLKKLEKHIGSPLETIPDKENSYRIKFTYEDQDFIYEDIEEQGFKDKLHFAYLKAVMPSKFTLTFTEKERKNVVGRGILMVSEVDSQSVKKVEKMTLPKGFERFAINTNDLKQANVLLKDPKIARVFLEFKNMDAAGYLSCSLRILDGVLILEFHASSSMAPSFRSIRADVSSIENYCKKLLLIIGRLRSE